MKRKEPTVVWRPIPNSSQELALDTRADETLYTGARGPGKTDTQLMRFRRRVGIGYGVFWRGVIFDREYKNLDDLVSKSKRWFRKFDDGARFLESKADYKWKWPTGEELLFRAIKTADDYWNYHGQEFPFIGWNELCKFPTMELYEAMLSTNRSSFTLEKDAPGRTDLPPIPLEVFSTTNPYGPGHNWVKTEFIDPVPYGKLQRRTSKVFDPKLQAEREVTKTRVAIFGSYKENIYLDATYVATLDAVSDPNIRKAWLKGDWDVVAGGALDDVWDKTKCVLPRFQIPTSWRIDRAFDWGSSHPFYVGWFAEANGEEAILPDGRRLCPPAGSLILCAEWYGTEKLGTNKGLKLSAYDIACGIIDREIEAMADDWFLQQPVPGPADNQIRDVREVDVDTIEKKMAVEGVRWKESDKSPGSRKNGLQLMRDALESTKKDLEKPRLYVMEHCRAAIGTLPLLPRSDKDPDDTDTTAEDHPYDAIRYRLLAGANRYVTKLGSDFVR